MSLASGVRATIRPWKAAVKPSKFLAEQPMNFKALPNSTTLTVVAPHVHEAPTAYVTTPGKDLFIAGIRQHHAPPKDVPLVDWGEIGKAFKTWKDFYILPPGFLCSVGEIAKAAVGDKLPGGGH